MGDCFVKDEYALVSEKECGTPFLREGVVPEVGMKLYMQVRQATSDPVLGPVLSQLSKRSSAACCVVRSS